MAGVGGVHPSEGWSRLDGSGLSRVMIMSARAKRAPRSIHCVGHLPGRPQQGIEDMPDGLLLLR